MIEAPCAACGTLNRIAEADVPSGARFVACASCKARVALPSKTVFGTSPIPKVPAIPSKTPPPVPARRDQAIDLADLPAPKRPSPLAGLEGSGPVPKSPLAFDSTDLPAPKPRQAPAPPPPPAATSSASLELDDLLPLDLPAPAAKSPRGVEDLPAPRTKPTGAPIDLPAPRARPTPPAMPTARPIDLPAPRPRADTPLDLPVPKPSAPDLPAPKGFFDDLPQPAKASSQARADKPDLPAPKGFFEDLPQPARTDKPDLPAPKGFFDDLPQPAKAGKPGLPAPKGFFDDLPQPAKASSQEKTDLPAPKGFFDDLPQPVASRAVFDDLAAHPHQPIADTPQSDISLDLAPSGSAGNLELGDAGGDSYRDLDLQEPSAKPGIRFQKPSAASQTSQPLPRPLSPAVAAITQTAAELQLEGEASRAAPIATPKPQPRPRDRAAQVAPSRRGRKVALVALLALVVLGAGGFYAYRRYTAAQARKQRDAEQLGLARAALTARGVTHWQAAAAAAAQVIEDDPKNGEALAIEAEAKLAGAIDNGLNGPAQIAGGRKRITDAIEAGYSGPALARAQALSAITQHQPDAAIAKLQPMIAGTPKNGFLLLYLGWAELAKGDAAAAVKAFDGAVAAGPNVKLPALYGHGRAKLMLADIAGARADFTAVLETAKDYIPAMVELAATLPPAQAAQRENDLLAILARPDIKTADPRAVVAAWTLAGDVARQAGRLDVARERYHKALAITPTDLEALTGLASVEMRDGKLEIAQDLIAKATAQQADSPEVKLAAAELAIKQGSLSDADGVLHELAARNPPLPPLLHAQLELTRGHLLEAQGADDDAVAAYEQGATDAGDLDLAPTMSAVEKLGALAQKADDPARAAAYRERASKLLSALDDRAQADPALGLTLGVAYLQAGDAAKAEQTLRRVVEVRDKDIDARIALAKALTTQGLTSEALTQLTAAHAIDKTRADVALELAVTYEAAGRDDDAQAAYTALLAAKDVSTAARARAGRYFARHGDIKSATAQADTILAAEPDNPAGHFLKGIGELADQKLEEARKDLAAAVDSDPDPQYLDAQGHAAEQSATEDSKYYDLAKRAYERATQADPKLFDAFFGLGRVQLATKDFDKAVAPLEAANRLQPSNGEVMFDLGTAARALGQTKAALPWFAAATKATPDRAEAWWELAQIYQDPLINEAKKAADTMSRATRLGAEVEKKTGKRLDWLTEAYYQLGNLYQLPALYNVPAARDAWSKYVSRDPPHDARLKAVQQALVTTLR